MLVAWGGILKSPSTRASTRFRQFVQSAGYTFGYTKTAGSSPKFQASHQRQTGRRDGIISLANRCAKLRAAVPQAS